METVPLVPADALTPAALEARLGRPDAPLVLDVRRAERFRASEVMLPLARHCTPEQLDDLVREQPAREVLVYCVYGHEVSQHAAARLRSAGWTAHYLLGGIEGGEPGVDPPVPRDVAALPRWRKRPDLGVAGQGVSHWVTRARPKIDRIACPWLVRRFVDREAQFHFVARDEVAEAARRLGAVPFDVPGVQLSHVGSECSFDALLAAFALQSPVLAMLATIVRAADTDQLSMAPPAAGLLAVSLGMSRLHGEDDHAMLAAMMPVYDALYAWCRDRVGGQQETHQWTPA